MMKRASPDPALRAAEKLIGVRVKRVVTDATGRVVAFEGSTAPQLKPRKKRTPATR